MTFKVTQGHWKWHNSMSYAKNIRRRGRDSVNALAAGALTAARAREF